MKRINLLSLSESIQRMSPRSKLFKTLKREVSLLGYWRNRPRGNPSKGYKVSKHESVD